jgi:hypothetical protein
MDEDLSDARAAVAWGESQLEVFDKRIVSWQQGSLEIAIVDINSDPGKKMWVLREKEPLPLVVNAEAGVIVNSLRSSLDILAGALAARNGVPPSSNTHFPIFRSHQEFIDPLTGIEGKKWLSGAERLILKSLKPYDGGNNFLWPLHQLDILRKHVRLITAVARPSSLGVGGAGVSEESIKRFGERRAKNETIICEIPTGAPKAMPKDYRFRPVPSARWYNSIPDGMCRP